MVSRICRSLVLTAMVAGCTADGLDAPAAELALDQAAFRCNVQPVLAARCSFPVCHGSARRPLSIFAPGRMRFEIGWDRPKAPFSDRELDDNFRVTSGFASTSATGESFLLTKPLDVDAGGYFHRGKDLYKEGDVFMTKDDPGYKLLAAWIDGETADPSCQATTEVGP